ncbi:MAG: histidine kinase dimerization/phospho-acceptor domain-containing protein [Pseudomonadota bacterium]
MAAIGSVVVLMGLVIYGGVSVWSVFRSDVLRYERAVLDTAFKFESDLLGFERDLFAFGSGVPDTSHLAVQERYGALRDGLSELRALGFAEAADGRGGAVLARLAGRLEDIAPTMAGLRDTVNGQTAALVVSVEMRDYLTAAKDLTRETAANLGAEAEATYAELRRSAQFSAFLSALAATAALVLIVWLVRDGLAAARLRDSNRHLASRAEVASRTKARFLAMMSHDLRTPLNGLLGNVALARASGLPERQDRLLEQADRAGQRLNMFLSDVLDYAAIQDTSLTPEAVDFEPQALRAEVEELIAGEARRHNVVVAADLSASAFQRVTGDMRLLRQAIGHVLMYLLETAGTKAVLHKYCVEEGELVVRLAFSYSDGHDRAGWVPELIVGAEDGRSDQLARDQLARDAFGPALARSLLEVLGGSILLDAQSERSVAIVIRTGAHVAVQRTYHVAIDISSRALAALCTARVSAPDVVVVPADAVGSGLVLSGVFVDAGRPDERSYVQTIRAHHPHATLVGIGETAQPDLYDEVLSLPLAGHGLQDAVRVAGAR